MAWVSSRSLLSSEPLVAAAHSQDTVPPRHGGAPAARLLGWLDSAVVGPFLDFVLRYRWQALLLLALIGTYRISDIVLGVMSNPFYATWVSPRTKSPRCRACTAC